MMHPTRIEALLVLAAVLVTSLTIAGPVPRTPATNAAGDLRTSAVPIQVTNVTPWNGQTIGSATPTIAVTYSDSNAGATVVGVNFQLDGMNLTSAGTFNQFVFALPLALELRSGPHYATFAVFDSVGASGVAAWSFTVDTIPPILVVTQPMYPMVPTTGILVAGSAVLANATLFRGAAPIRVTATVLPLGFTNSSLAAPDGSFAMGVPLTEGVNLIFVNATDRVGNLAVVIRSVVRDTTKPMLRIFTPTSLVSSSSTVRVSGQTEPGAYVFVNGFSVAVNPLGGNWSVNLTLPDGVDIITVAAADQVGNVNVTGFGILVDSDAPRLTLTSPGASLTNDDHVTVSGTAADTRLVALLVNGDSVPTAANGSFSVTLTLPEGLDPIVVVAVDAAQHITSVRTEVRVDTTPPVVTLSYPPDGLETSTPTVVLRGSVDDPNATVLVDRAMIRPDARGHWQAAVGLTPGGNTISVSAVDVAGNQAAPIVLHMEYFSPIPGLQNGTSANQQSLDEQAAVFRLSLVGLVLVFAAVTFALHARMSRRIREDRRVIAELVRRATRKP